MRGKSMLESVSKKLRATMATVVWRQLCATSNGGLVIANNLNTKNNIIQARMSLKICVMAGIIKLIVALQFISTKVMN